MSKWIPLLTALGLLWGQNCDAATIEQLRAALAADAHGAPGEQHIHLGPLKDGREFDVTSKIVNDSSAVNIRRTSPDAFLINVGRSLSIEAFFIADASLICARFPQTACARMPDYIERVLGSADPAKAPILEEVFPDLLNEAQSSRSDEVLYNASLMSSIETLMAMITFHELGHAALHHLDAPAPNDITIVRQEGEADGFASFVARVSGLSPVGLTTAFLLDATQETVTGSKPVTHPSAACRAAVMTQSGVEWLKENKQAILKPSGDKARDELALKLFNQALANNPFGSTDPRHLAGCDEYVVSFASGERQAVDLVDQNTNLQSVVPGQR